jgi:hypothetical protein
MSLFRLLPFSLLLIVSVATVAGQSSPQKSSANVQSVEPGELSSSGANPFSANFQTGLKPNTADRILLGDYRPKQSQFSVPRNWLKVDPDPDSLARTCFKIRTYKVARDGRNTDSTHPVSYTTCTPAARFQSHSIVLRTP